MSSTGSRSTPSSPVKIFRYWQCLWVNTVRAACSYSSASRASPKGRSAPNTGAQKLPASNKQGQRTNRNLIRDLKSQTPCVCAAQGCSPSQAGLHWFARWHSKEPTLDAICHPRHRHPLPVVDETLHLEGCTPPSGQCSTSWLERTRLSGDAEGPARKTEVKNKLVAAGAPLLPATFPLPHIRGAPGKSKAGSRLSAGKTALAGR